MIYLALLRLIPNKAFEELKQTQKTFSWRNHKVEIKHDY